MSDEPELCMRWGEGKDRCVRHYDHDGECKDAKGRTEQDRRRELGMKPKETK